MIIFIVKSMNIQKLLLKDFELRISANTWNQAEDLVQAGAVQRLRELERHFWVAQVHDGEETHETEVIITPSRIKAFACDCSGPGRRFMCAHVAAMLVKVRQFLDQKAIEQQDRAAEKVAKGSSRLTIGEVLKSIETEALHDFIQEYAKQDRNFSLSLKTWFAGAVQRGENTYAVLWNSLLPKAGKPMQDAAMRQLRKTLGDLNKRAARALREGDYRLVFEIATAILPGIAALEQNHPTAPVEDLWASAQQLIGYLMELETAALSPELANQVRELLLHALPQKALDRHFRDKMLLYLGRGATDKATFGQIEQHFSSSAPDTAGIEVLLYCVAQIERGMPEAVAKILTGYGSRPDFILETLSALRRLNYPAAILPAIEKLEKLIPFTPEQQRQLQQLSYYAAQTLGDKAPQIAYLKRQFLDNKQQDALTRLRELSPEEWPELRQQLLGILEQMGDQDRLAAFYTAERMAPELIQLLEKSEDIAFLQRHEAFLLPENADFVYHQYLKFLSVHLEAHFGGPAAQEVRRNLQSLVQKGQLPLVKRISDELQRRYPERSALPEEMAELFSSETRKHLRIIG